MRLGHAQDIGRGYCLHRLLILKNEILGIAEIGVAYDAIQRLQRAVKAEDEGVQHAVLGFLEGSVSVTGWSRIFRSSTWIASMVSVVVIDLVLPTIRNVPG